MILAAAASKSKALWYLTRGFGLISLILLTTTTVLGVAQVARYARPGWPRFVVSAIHRNASLISLVAIAIHVLTAVADSYAPIHLADVVFPFVSRYRPLWTGLGALTLDMMAAVIITSLVRVRIGHRLWRAVHWLAYASWPVAAAHGLGTGSDARSHLVDLLYLLCAAAVLGAVAWRLALSSRSVHPARWTLSAGMAVVVPVALVAFAAWGPLRTGWAKRAGTPSKLIASSATTSPSAGSSGSATSPGGGTSTGHLSLPLRANFTGSATTSQTANGDVTIRIQGRVGSGTAELVLSLTGPPAGGGGIELSSGTLAVGSASSPSELSGPVTGLSGPVVLARVTGPSGTATARVNITELSPSGAVTGNIEVSG